MTAPLFLTEHLPAAVSGALVSLEGPDGRHAAVVRRIAVGEVVMIGDGLGRAVRGPVVRADRSGLAIEATEWLQAPEESVRYVAVQALAKTDRGELAVEMLTELGVSELVPWSAHRSVVRWSGERAAKSLGRWRSTAREAAKQARRLRLPTIGDPVDLRGLSERVAAADLAVVLHEESSGPIAEVSPPRSGEVLIVIGPEGGIAPEELAGLVAAGGCPVSLGDGVLRTSTAGIVALAALKLR